ncbi:hypothetical protein QFC22_000816 [Naganishia vaughanmartiniae]|uniref:Uncharacterized protein n=1 Tax=Naganishia vaughanmartiniae TaxID=1424756 RepID=A0ACC2XK64_9TREE|nr:hypothetical protein QFC22_000816 [Naganishia vaughanmartiniae]
MATELFTELNTKPLDDDDDDEHAELLSDDNEAIAEKVVELEGSLAAQGEQVDTTALERIQSNGNAARLAHHHTSADTSIPIPSRRDENMAGSESQRQNPTLPNPTASIAHERQLVVPARSRSPIIPISSTTNMSTFTFPINNTPAPAAAAAAAAAAANDHKLTPRSPPSFSIDETASPSSLDLPEPSSSFTFGSFRLNEPTTHLMGTPTAELGPFDYPVVDGGLAIGAAMSPAIRRLVEDDQQQGNPHSLVPPPPGFTPSLRRTSSTSTVPITPAGGRRPSVVHSNTVPQADAGRRLSLVTGGDGEGLGPHSASAIVAAVDEEERMLRHCETTGTGTGTGSEHHVRRDAGTGRIRRSSMASVAPSFSSSAAAAASSPASISGTTRRPSILAFAHQRLPDTPIPPSLAHLASTLRRGSIPAVHHFATQPPTTTITMMDMPSRDRQSSVSSTMSSMRSSISSASGMTAAVARNSLTGPVFINQGTRDEHMTVSSAYLYQRRSSLASTSRGLLSSKAPLPPIVRPGLLPNQQRTGSISSSSESSESSHPSSSGSRESIMTIRDLRDWEGESRPAGGSTEGPSIERNRRMSMPSLPSPSSSSSVGADHEGSHWLPKPQPQLRSSSVAHPSSSTDSSKFSFPPQVSTTYVKPRPFKLGMPPSPRMNSPETFGDQPMHSTSSSSSPSSSSSSRTTRSSSSSSKHSGTPPRAQEDRSSTVKPYIPSSSEDSSDLSAEQPTTDTPCKRSTYRISQRGIEERERRRSSRMSALMTTPGGNSLETIPSDYVVDFSSTPRSSAVNARSSFGSSSGADMASQPRVNHPGTSKHATIKAETGAAAAAPVAHHAGQHERSALSTSSSEEGPEEVGLSSDNDEKGHFQPNDDDEQAGVAGVSSAFRAFAFPASKRNGSAYKGNGA